MAASSSTSSSKAVQRFLVKLLAFGLIMLALDYALGSTIEYFFRRTLYGENWPKENLLLSSPNEMVVFGSSRAFRHYVPSIISEETGLECFNAGANGQYLLYAYALEQLMYDRYTPRVVVLDVLPSYLVDLSGVEKEYDKLKTLLPFVYNREVRWLLSRHDRFAWLKQQSRLYRYNSRVLSILSNYRNKRDVTDHGYVDVGKVRFHEVNPFIVDGMDSARVRIDSFKVRIFQRFVHSAREHGSTVVISFSPTVEPLSPKVRRLLAVFDRLCLQLGVPFVKVLTSEYPEFADRSLFMDYIHMNSAGAERFSRIFGRRLAEIVSGVQQRPVVQRGEHGVVRAAEAQKSTEAAGG